MAFTSKFHTFHTYVTQDSIAGFGRNARKSLGILQRFANMAFLSKVRLWLQHTGERVWAPGLAPAAAKCYTVKKEGREVSYEKSNN